MRRSDELRLGNHRQLIPKVVYHKEAYFICGKILHSPSGNISDADSLLLSNHGQHAQQPLEALPAPESVHHESHVPVKGCDVVIKPCCLERAVAEGEYNIMLDGELNSLEF